MIIFTDEISFSANVLSINRLKIYAYFYKLPVVSTPIFSETSSEFTTEHLFWGYVVCRLTQRLYTVRNI